MRGVALAALLLTACSGTADEVNEAEIANRAESLERAADATTSDLINQIEAQTAEDMASEAPQAAENETAANQASAKP